MKRTLYDIMLPVHCMQRLLYDTSMACLNLQQVAGRVMAYHFAVSGTCYQSSRARSSIILLLFVTGALPTLDLT